MKTFIEIMKWVGGAMAIIGFFYAVGMMVADATYLGALGEIYYDELSAIAPWDVIGILVIGCALATLFIILEAVFNAGERSASKKSGSPEEK